MDPILLIKNDAAEVRDKANLDAALAVLHASASVEVASPHNPGELDGVLHRAASRRIVVAGDDRAWHRVVNALYKRHDLADAVLGLIPLGVQSEFARSVGIPLAPAVAATTAVSGHRNRMNLIVDELGEIVVDRVTAGPSCGEPLDSPSQLASRLRSILTELRPPTLRLRVEVDGTVVADLDQQLLQIRVRCEADPLDECLDIRLVRPGGALTRPRLQATLLRGREVTVSGQEFWLRADGTTSAPERRRSWRIEPGAYSLLLPTAPRATGSPVAG